MRYNCVLYVCECVCVCVCVCMCVCVLYHCGVIYIHRVVSHTYITK